MDNPNTQPIYSTPLTQPPSLFAGASPKLTFVVGLLTGVAVVSLAGFVLVGSYLFSGKSPVTSPNSLAQGDPNTQVPNPNQPSQPPAKVDIALKSSDYVRGSAEAPVTIFEYSDLECPFCKRFHPAMQQLMNEYAGRVRWVYRHYPLDITCNSFMANQLHPNACQASAAAECVGKLAGGEKFWNFIDALLSDEAAPDRAKVIAVAKSLGVSESALTSCMTTSEITSKVQTDIQEGSSYGVQGTPTSFVNGTPVEGAVSYEQLKSVVEQALQ